MGNNKLNSHVIRKYKFVSYVQGIILIFEYIQDKFTHLLSIVIPLVVITLDWEDSSIAIYRQTNQTDVFWSWIWL
jgi:hypothetical protein